MPHTALGVCVISPSQSKVLSCAVLFLYGCSMHMVLWTSMDWSREQLCMSHAVGKEYPSWKQPVLSTSCPFMVVLRWEVLQGYLVTLPEPPLFKDGPAKTPITDKSRKPLTMSTFSNTPVKKLEVGGCKPSGSQVNSSVTILSLVSYECTTMLLWNKKCWYDDCHMTLDVSIRMIRTEKFRQRRNFASEQPALNGHYRLNV